MKVKYLLPARFKKIGWLLLLPCLALGIPTVILDLEPEFLYLNVLELRLNGFSGDTELIELTKNNVLNEILAILTIIGGLIVAFSQELDEDELIANMRLRSLVWAIYWNYGILACAFLLVYDLSFFLVMEFNMFTPLILFIAKFNWQIRKFRKAI